MRRLENEDEEKFFEAWIKDGVVFCYRYGKIGSNGHVKLKKLKSPAEAEAELAKWVEQKIAEGFSDPNAEEEPEEEEAEEEPAEEEAADEESDEADEESDGDEESESDGDDDGDEESDGDDGDEESDDGDDEESESDDDESDDGDDDDDEDDEPRGGRGRGGRLVVLPPPVVPAGPVKPTLPRRFSQPNSQPVAPAVARAVSALEELGGSVGARSWKVERAAKRARRALAELGGLDVASNAQLSAAFDAAMNKVIAPKKRLSLEDAMMVLSVADAATFARTVKRWRSKMLDAPSSVGIGLLGATLDAVGDPEVAIHVGGALVNRKLDAAQFRRWFAKLRPFLEEALAKKKSDLSKFAASLKPGKDALAAARISEVKA
ncbi:MAG: WGR domain-containing protein [Polyangiaceae bacterium]